MALEMILSPPRGTCREFVRRSPPRQNLCDQWSQHKGDLRSTRHTLVAVWLRRRLDRGDSTRRRPRRRPARSWTENGSSSLDGIRARRHDEHLRDPWKPVRTSSACGSHQIGGRRPRFYDHEHWSPCERGPRRFGRATLFSTAELLPVRERLMYRTSPFAPSTSPPTPNVSCLRSRHGPVKIDPRRSRREGAPFPVDPICGKYRRRKPVDVAAHSRRASQPQPRRPQQQHSSHRSARRGLAMLHRAALSLCTL